MDITTHKVNDRWELFTLANDNGMEVEFLNYGGIITKVLVPDKNNNIENIVLGYPDYKEYESDPNFFGAIIGPVAGRIEKAEFTLKDKIFKLEKNDGNHHLHGGSNALHRVIWDTETFETDGKVGVTLSYESVDGENGYPGNLTVSVNYTLTSKNQLMIDYEATTDKTTPVTLTNHTYFNLTGDINKTIRTHQVLADSHQFLELNGELIPTGKIIDVANSTFDFREGRELKDGIIAGSEQNKIVGNGYDHYFLFDHAKETNVVVKEEVSGRVLAIETNQPGMVLYTGQNIVEGLELNGGTSKKYSGVCFETQSSPASLHQDGLPMVILGAGETYKKQTIFSFFVE
ncbi:MAG: aldose 1-epimerase [Carnobacterium sp.]|uniref:aldose epimerase family protein n=1 Tax=Carnobacterium sp. TaxID=48221 RepID=UPI0026483EC3|nr:aldose epimerase family protein [Carnobacterium sp.]MDN5372709.1 aldose 1-epimerase [Carnobacterium sp.]